MANAVALCDGEARGDDLDWEEITPMQSGIGRRLGIVSVLGFCMMLERRDYEVKNKRRCRVIDVSSTLDASLNLSEFVDG